MTIRVTLQLIMMSMCMIVVALAFGMMVNPQETDQVLLGGLAIPELCQTKSLFGLNCPGCGLTRSFIYMAHGDVPAAVRMHVVGALLFVLTLIGIPFFAINAFLIRRGQASLIGERAASWMAIMSVVLLLSHWVIRLITG